MSKLRQSVLETIRILGNHSECHQLPERSFFYKGKQFPVCARCTGVFFGQSAAIILAVLRVKVDYKKSFLLLMIMGFDWFIQAVHLKESTNFRRAVTGFLGGLGLVCIYVNTLQRVIRFLIMHIH